LALATEQPFDAREIALGRGELERDRLQGALELLNLRIVSLQLFEVLKLIAQNQLLR